MAKNHFGSCELDWTVWPWGVAIAHSDTDYLPECSMEFGVMQARPTPPYHGMWARLDFDHAAFVRCLPHKDDETLDEVTGYSIAPIEAFKSEVRPLGSDFSMDAYKNMMSERAALEQLRLEEWLDTGICHDPDVYFSTDTDWLDEVRELWTERQRAPLSPSDAIHLLINGRDGYVEIVATGFRWRLWERGHPTLSDVSGEPITEGRWQPPADSWPSVGLHRD